MCAFHATLPATVQDRKNKSIGGCFALCLSAAAQASTATWTRPCEPAGCRGESCGTLPPLTPEPAVHRNKPDQRPGQLPPCPSHGPHRLDRPDPRPRQSGETGFGSQSGYANCGASPTEKAPPNIISADGGWLCGRDRHASLLLNSDIVRDAVSVPPPGIAALAQGRILDGA
jgi:hypothetical protein